MCLSQILPKKAGQDTPDLTSRVRLVPGVLLFSVDNIATSLIPVLVAYLSGVRLLILDASDFSGSLPSEPGGPLLSFSGYLDSSLRLRWLTV